MSTTESDHIVVETEGRVRTLRINRPEKKNALTAAMYGRLTEELERAAGDPAIRVMVITGAGDTFTSGNDLNDFLKRIEDASEPQTFRFLRRLPSFPKPLVAAVNGAAVGIGTTMLLHCDLVYARTEATFILPFAALGLCPEAGSSLILPRVAGLQRATELLMLGEPFDAQRAKEVGIVNEVVPSDQLLPRVAERSATIAALPPSSVRATKALVRHEVRAQIAETIEREIEVFMRLLSAPEATEAMSAFFEKRPPDFSKFE
jgi:enoyl-CoA hydratase/carnithine racemase